MKWNNIKGQLSLLHGLLLLGPDAINFSQFACAKVISNEDINLSTIANRNILLNLSSQTWNCYEIYELACKLVDTEYFEDVRPLFELASRQCSELLCIALAMFNPSWNSILKEILVKLTCGFLLGQASSSVVLPRIWKLNPNIMLLCMVEMHRRDAACLSRLLDVAQDLKILSVVLDSKPYSFALDVAALASRRQHLNLDKWLTDSVLDKGDIFLKATAEFLIEKIKLQSTRFEKPVNIHFVPLSPEVITVFVRTLQAAPSTITSECQDILRTLFQLLSSEGLAISPRGPELATGISSSAPENTVFAQDVQDEVNALFEKIYTKEFPIEDVIELLKRLRASNSVRDQQLFSCFIQNLFDEYRFFAMYPDNELILTATTFGLIIKHQLISHVPLGVGLRYVLEALKKPTAHKLFKFGVQALIQFQRRLYEWPQYCSHLLQIPHLCQSYPDLVSFLQSVIAGNPHSNLPFPEEEASSGTQGVEVAGSDGSSVLASRAQITAPNELVRERILFVLNNLSTANLDQKVIELRRVLTPVHFPWFAQYLVVKRASSEVNYHPLYVLLIESFGDDRLLEHVMKETFTNIEALLKDNKTLNSSSERLLLKNLGMWLGSLTLARNRPILHDDFSLKDTLIDAIVSSKLLIVIPFACKVLEQGIHGRVFRPFNPYLMGTLRLLVELYKYADLKLNLKFEIEVLCKNLGLDIKNVKPTNLLKDVNRLHRTTRQLPASGMPSSSGAFAGSSSTLPEFIVMPLINSLAALLQANRLNPQDFSNLIKIFPMAVEYALREMAFSVSERSINIAAVTARAIISKDFPAKLDIKYIKSCALGLTQYLASSLALTSFKESVRPAILSNIRTFVQIAELNNPFSDMAWMSLIEENIENISSFIESGTADKVANDFDQIFNSEWISKSTAADAPRTYETYEAILSHKRYSRPVNLSLSDVKIIAPGEYDQLVNGLRALSVQSPIPYAPAEHVQQPPAPKPAAAPIVNSTISVPDVLDIFVKLLGHIERACSSCEEKNVSKLHPDSEIRRLMKQVIPLASSQPSHRDEVCLLMCQRLMQLLYKNMNALFADVIILLLVKIFEFSAKVAKEVTTWIIYAEDDRKYNVLATWSLFNSGLVYVLDYDAQLARQVEKSPESTSNFAVNLIRRCVFDEPAVAAPYDFVYSLDALKTAYGQTKAESIKALLDDLSAKTHTLHLAVDSKQSRDAVVFWFTDWFRLCQYPSISDKLVESFMTQLFERGFFRDESFAKNFFQVCTESAVEIFVRQRRSPAILSYRSVEAYARLTIQILQWCTRPEVQQTMSSTPRELLIIALKIMGIILAQGFDQSMDYLQKPFSRFIFCFIGFADEEIAKSKESSAWILDVVADFLCSISPLKMPKFSFAWFEALTHPALFSHLLQAASGQDLLVAAFIDLFDFLSPIAAQVSFHEPTFVFYKGLLKTFAIILHDKPEFFVSRHVELCAHIPREFVQLRNLVLSAVPFGAVLPDPLSPGLKIDTLEGMKSKPEINMEFIVRALRDTSLMGLADEPNSALLQISSISDQLTDAVISHAFVAYCGYKVGQNMNDSSMKSMTLLLCSVLTIANSEIRNELLTAMANHLRYPNCLTYFFSCVLLYSFRQSEDNEKLSSQLVRVLLERLIVYRPHPWGLMITFMELIRNPEYRFWQQSIIKSSHEVQKMFETVAKSCLIKIPAAEPAYS